LALKIASEYGKVIILGSPRGTCKVNFYQEVHRRGIHTIEAHNRTRPKFESHHGWWTQQEDDPLILKLISKGLLKVKNLITLKMSFQEARNAHMRLIEDKESILGIILDWSLSS